MESFVMLSGNKQQLRDVVQKKDDANRELVKQNLKKIKIDGSLFENKETYEKIIPILQEIQDKKDEDYYYLIDVCCFLIEIAYIEENNVKRATFLMKQVPSFFEKIENISDVFHSKKLRFYEYTLNLRKEGVVSIFQRAKLEYELIQNKSNDDHIAIFYCLCQMRNNYLFEDKKDLAQDIAVYAEIVENNIINKTDRYHFRKFCGMGGLGFRYLHKKNYVDAELALVSTINYIKKLNLTHFLYLRASEVLGLRFYRELLSNCYFEQGNYLNYFKNNLRRFSSLILMGVVYAYKNSCRRIRSPNSLRERLLFLKDGSEAKDENKNHDKKSPVSNQLVPAPASLVLEEPEKISNDQLNSICRDIEAVFNALLYANHYIRLNAKINADRHIELSLEQDPSFKIFFIKYKHELTKKVDYFRADSQEFMNILSARFKKDIARFDEAQQILTIYNFKLSNENLMQEKLIEKSKVILDLFKKRDADSQSIVLKAPVVTSSTKAVMTKKEKIHSTHLTARSSLKAVATSHNEEKPRGLTKKKKTLGAKEREAWLTGALHELVMLQLIRQETNFGLEDNLFSKMKHYVTLRSLSGMCVALCGYVHSGGKLLPEDQGIIKDLRHMQRHFGNLHLQRNIVEESVDQMLAFLPSVFFKLKVKINHLVISVLTEDQKKSLKDAFIASDTPSLFNTFEPVFSQTKLYVFLSQLHHKLQVEIDPAKEWANKVFHQTLPDIEIFFNFLKKGAGSSSSKSSVKDDEIFYQTNFMPIEAIRMCLTICGEFYNPTEPLELAGIDKGSPLYNELKAFLTFCHFEFCNKDFHEHMKRDSSILNSLYKACEQAVQIRQKLNDKPVVHVAIDPPKEESSSSSSFSSSSSSKKEERNDNRKEKEMNNTDTVSNHHPYTFLNSKRLLNKEAAPFFPKSLFKIF